MLGKYCLDASESQACSDVSQLGCKYGFLLVWGTNQQATAELDYNAIILWVGEDTLWGVDTETSEFGFVWPAIKAVSKTPPNTQMAPSASITTTLGNVCRKKWKPGYLALFLRMLTLPRIEDEESTGLYERLSGCSVMLQVGLF